ncbi:MAG TPA: SRPBCC domain-containing protein [Terrimicrobiaceae bacterium]|nr:SRPBCC domain-containing protein [Terrimicrobiaceae bacterium]
MPTPTAEQTIRTLEITKDVEISAPIEIVFETLLEHLGPLHETGPDSPLPMKLEPWPGGRWYRDLGNNTGHFWGHVQVIKPPKLLEICGPVFMSFPAISHLQYRLTTEGEVTRLRLVHGAMGQIPPDWLESIDKGMEPWSHTLARVREVAERRKGATDGHR